MSDYRLYLGDCLDVMPALDSDSVDTIITDPPYGLSFMGKDWDHGVPGQRFWREALRVAKPGAMLLAFGGTRTHHRLMVAIEDAGWEIRDCIFWTFGSGFPKSHNIQKALSKRCECGIMGADEKVKSDAGTVEKTEAGAARKEPPPEHRLRPLRKANLPSAFDVKAQRREVLQSRMSKQGASANERGQFPTPQARARQSSVEGGRDVLQETRQLYGSSLRESAEMGTTNGAKGRIHNGTPSNNGADSRSSIDEKRDSTSSESQPVRQSPREPGIMAHEREPQKSGVGQDCDRCGKPYIPQEVVKQWEGWGTALKPAYEIIIVAMKPLDGTFANNALTHGVAGLWIDGATVPTNGSGDKGRWPANLIHDGSDEVVGLFPQAGGGFGKRGASTNIYGGGKGFTAATGEVVGYNDSGSAARFFYCAKASRRERNAGLEGMEVREKRTLNDYRNPSKGRTAPKNGSPMQNHHPTVKPIALMRYLARLTKTPTGGVVLDPFMGSGSTGIAALLEGRSFIGIEMDAGYLRIAERRIVHHWQKAHEERAEPRQLELVP